MNDGSMMSSTLLFHSRKWSAKLFMKGSRCGDGRASWRLAPAFLRERASRAMERLGGSSITRDFYYFLILNYFCC